MDTRAKIIDLEAAAGIAAGLRRGGARIRLAAGYFDVLTPGLVRRFQSLGEGGPVFAAVLDPDAPLLGARARAELAAALRVIDYVFPIADGDLERAIEKIGPDEVIREEAADRRRSRGLIEHVHGRQRA
jgi:hypothetical protein